MIGHLSSRVKTGEHRLIVTLTGNLMNIYQDHETAQTEHIN